MRVYQLILLLTMSSCAMPPPAFAHDSWISRGGLKNGAGEWCCGEGDCFVVPKSQVKTTNSGLSVTFTQIQPNQRGTGSEEVNKTEIIPYADVQPSEDGEYWRCKKPDGARRCFFGPLGGW